MTWKILKVNDNPNTPNQIYLYFICISMNLTKLESANNIIHLHE